MDIPIVTMLSTSNRQIRSVFFVFDKYNGTNCNMPNAK